jgi:hypothetical protein
MHEYQGHKIQPFKELIAEKVARDGDVGLWPRNPSLGDPRIHHPTDQRPRPDANSKILKQAVDSSSALFTVIDGIAYGWSNHDQFTRVHCEYITITDATGKQVTFPCVTYDLALYGDIVGAMMDPNAYLVQAPGSGTACLVRDGYFHPIASGRAFDNYQFSWWNVPKWSGTQDDWNRLKGGVVLSEKTGGRYTS